MSIVQPGATDTTLSKNHAQLHCIVAVDSSAPNESIVVGSTGNVGIGTSSPSQTLEVAGNGYIRGTLDLGGTVAVIQGVNGVDLSLNSSGGDVYTNAWSDYSATSTIVGFSSVGTKSIRTKKVGKTVQFSIYIAGTSNATGFTATMPYAIDTNDQGQFIGRASDNNGVTVAGVAAMSSSTMIFYKDATGAGNWTNSGTKYFIVNGTYQAA